jgi:hypothetical protein
MDNRKLMEAAEAVVRINARLKEEGWEMLRFVPKVNPYNGCALLKLEIMRISENPDTLNGTGAAPGPAA